LHTMEKGYLQHKAELSRFDDSVVRNRQAFEQAAFEKAAQLRSSDPLGDAVPGNDNIVFNPNHHSADYAGFVSRDALEKAHYQGKTKESLVRVDGSDGGVVPAPNVQTSDHTGIGRRHFENDVRFASREVVPGSAPLIADPSYYMEGGDSDRFQSTAMAAQSSQPTNPVSYSIQSSKHPNVGKKHVVPAFDQKGQGQPYLNDSTNNRRGSGGSNHMQLGMGYNQEAPRNRGDLVGYRATAFKPGAPSMMAGIGSSIVNSGVCREFPDRPVKRETIADVRSREKGTHLLDVTPGLPPGYTGRAMR